MKRKISLLLCLLLGLLCFTGCAKEEEPVKYDEAVIAAHLERVYTGAILAMREELA